MLSLKLSHCRKNFSGFYDFYVTDSNYLNKRVIFGRCPVCRKAIYQEIKTDYFGNVSYKSRMGKEAEIAFEKALFSRLCFISKVQQGSRSKQHWCYGDCKESGKLQFQIKRNFNGVEVENFGEAKVICV